MEEEIYKKLSELACRLSNMTFVLSVYCENFEQDITEFAKISDFTRMLNEASEELFDLL